MEWELWLIAVSFVAIALNFIHWRFRLAEQLLYVPTSGIVAVLNVAMHFAVIAAALLCLARMVPAMLFLVLLFGGMAATQMYSVWARHHQRRVR